MGRSPSEPRLALEDIDEAKRGAAGDRRIEDRAAGGRRGGGRAAQQPGVLEGEGEVEGFVGKLGVRVEKGERALELERGGGGDSAERGDQRQSEAIRGNQRQSEAIRGNHLGDSAERERQGGASATRSDALRTHSARNQKHSEARRTQSEALRSSQKQAEALGSSRKHPEALGSTWSEWSSTERKSSGVCRPRLK